MSTPLESSLFSTAAGAEWRAVGVRHHHGIALPLFSLHSSKSGGIGEYPDLLPLIEWCRSIGFDVIQLLPLNDTGMEASPYSALSAFALNPLYLGLHDLPLVENVPEYRAKLSQLSFWNNTERVAFEIIRELKGAFLREYFEAVFPHLGEKGEYLSFVEQHKSWLFPYALFKTLKELHEWKSWEEWPLPHRSPGKVTYDELQEIHRENIHFHIFLQYLAFKQLEEVRRFGEKSGVYIKGDIPILTSRDSADVWHERHYFWMDYAAGAPPDVYAKEGQIWGFPTYDWEAMEKDDYAWWRRRLLVASHFYHLYRLDHIVGFFRLWSIPLGKSAREGSFVPAHEEEWIPHGEKIMEMMLKTAPMLPIGEDLGLVPQEVRLAMRKLGIAGTKVMRWERYWEKDGTYIDPKEYIPESMTCVSTHDTDPLQLWWRHFPKEAKLFSDFKGWDYLPFLSLERHREILYDSHHSGSLFHINLLQEYLALFPTLVSPSSREERINVPGKILDTNWTYRFVPSVEQLVEHIPLKETLRSLIRP